MQKVSTKVRQSLDCGWCVVLLKRHSGAFYSENAMRKARSRARCILDTKARLQHASSPEPFRDPREQQVDTAPGGRDLDLKHRVNLSETSSESGSDSLDVSPCSDQKRPDVSTSAFPGYGPGVDRSSRSSLYPPEGA